VYDLNFTQHINTATHIQGNILDLILADTDDDFISNVIVYPYNNQPIRSDHFLISFEICHDAHNQSRSNPKYIYDYSKVDYTGLFHYLSTSNIYSCLQFDEVETVWTIINQTLHQAIDLFIPKVRIRTKQYPKWFNSQLIHEANCLWTLRKKYSLSPTNHNLNHLTVAEKSFSGIC